VRVRSKKASEELVTKSRISVSEVLESVEDQGAGAIVLFLGTVRNSGASGEVSGMTYEAYGEMAQRELSEIRDEILERWPVKKVRIVHRVGKMQLKDISVAVAVSSPHRSDAFEACRFGIERIKKEVPIWKKETLASGGEAWVEGEEIVSTADARAH